MVRSSRSRTCLWSLDLESGSVERLADVTGGDARVALNDGRCDGAGQFWVGSYARNERDAVGGVFRVGTDRTVTRVAGGVTVGNGLDWSPDGGRSTSPTRRARSPPSTWRTACRSGRGSSPATTTARRTASSWTPRAVSGARSGTGGGSSGTRLDGRVDRVIELPVQRPTAAAFGGPGLDTLFVTSATYGLDAAARAAQPLAGLVFALDVGVRGRPTTLFGG